MHIPIARPSIKPASRRRLFAEFTRDEPGSAADTVARDSAVVAGLALQRGVPVDVLREALLRDLHGAASEFAGLRIGL